MPLADLIHCCLFCGAETVREKDGGAHCRGCERIYRSLTGGDGFVIHTPNGLDLELATGDLIDQLNSMDTHSGPLESSAVARFARLERPVRYRGAIMGFYEERGPDRPGRLRLDDQGVLFTEKSGEQNHWPLTDLRAVQTSSGSIQISPLEGGLVSFRILEASPHRWEEVLKARLRDLWRLEGRGEIIEFQPRIRAS